MVLLTPAYAAVIVTGVEALTGVVVMVKEADVLAFCWIVSEAGTDATAGFELDSVTAAPPGGAG
jgi:hypothetical protein